MTRPAGKQAVRLCQALLLLSLPAAAGQFTDELWTGIRPVYSKTLEHPFLKGLADGSLPKSRFRFYLQQDAQYLSEFSKVLSVLASKAPLDQWAITLHQHAADALKTERQLHESLLGPGGATPAEMSPTNRAYSNHLLAVAHQRSFGEGLAAVLPCYWIYWEVGKELKKRGSRNPDYQRWIDQYADAGFGEAVRQVLAMMNEEAGRMDAGARERARRWFTLSARYEYMFWDMAWREEKWPP